MLLPITKRCNIRITWKGWQEHNQQVMIWYLQTQHNLCMLCFGELLSTAVCSAKHTRYLLHVSDKVEESSRWKHMVFVEIEHVASKKLGLQINWKLRTNEFYNCNDTFSVIIKRQRENFESWVKGHMDGPQGPQIHDPGFKG